ncbi:MAG: hypothetical protein KJ906_02000, partial [Nanoarchaeota archaeon]|nr:hypothetical protein [Nanoarchaeota archaeon]
GKNGLYISLDFIELGNDDLYSKPFNYIMGKLTDLEYVKMHYGDGKIAYEINENVAKKLSDRNSVFLREFSENELNILQDAVHLVK